MKLNDLKRKFFFWTEKLQISRKERISVTMLLALLAILLTINLSLKKTFNYSQEQYDQITAEFERRSALILQQQKALEEKYNPDIMLSKSATQEARIEKSEQDMENPPSISAKKININTANSEQLQSLKGIGETYAKRIIEYRKVYGAFQSIDELVNVKGIGEKRLENIRPFLTLEDSLAVQ